MPLPRHPAQPDGQKHFKNQNYLCNLQRVKYGLLIRLPSTRMFSAQRTRPTQPRSTVLSGDEEAIVVAFRRHTLLSLDDCLYALQPTIPHLTRSSLHRSRKPIASALRLSSVALVEAVPCRLDRLDRSVRGPTISFRLRLRHAIRKPFIALSASRAVKYREAVPRPSAAARASAMSRWGRFSTSQSDYRSLDGLAEMKH